MRITIIRYQSNKDGTRGHLYLENGWTCDCLELPWMNNLKGKSCILPDTYKAWNWFSPTFNREVVRLEDKHNRADCLIHAANFAGDVDQGEFTQIHGCIAVGHTFGLIARPDGKGQQMGVLSSRATLEGLMKQIGPGPHIVEIKWES